MFPHLAEKGSAIEAQTLLILGDLTDAKDRHSSVLVNKTVDALTALSKRIPEIVIMSGNHDWLLQGSEFFRFVNHIPGVRFLTKPTTDTLDGRSVMFLPYSKNPRADWAAVDLHTFEPEVIFMHQTIKGAIASNGEEMEGEDLPLLPASARIYSGDIHVPQTIRKEGGAEITYVGSPYHVHFGDDFSPRILMLDRRFREHWWTDFKTPRRVSLKVPDLAAVRRLDLEPGDHVKLRFDLDPADRHRWAAIRREAILILEDMHVEVAGLQLTSPQVGPRITGMARQIVRPSPSASVFAFAERESLPVSAIDAALDIIEAS